MVFEIVALHLCYSVGT